TPGDQIAAIVDGRGDTLDWSTAPAVTPVGALAPDGLPAALEALASPQSAIPNPQFSAGVASIPSMTTGQFVTIDASGNAGDALQSVQVYDTPQTAVTLPWGLFSFNVTGIAPGASATVQMTLPPDAVPTSYYKQDPVTGRMLPFLFDGTTGAEINGNVITL